MSSCVTKPIAAWTSDDVHSRVKIDTDLLSTFSNIMKTNETPHSKDICDSISKIVVDYLEEYSCFGEDKWTALCGRVDPPPLLPEGFSALWNGPCPVFPGKKIRETHLLVYIPATVDETPFTLKKLGKIAKRYFSYNNNLFNPADYGFGFIWSAILNEQGDKTIDRPRWVLVTKAVLPSSVNKSYYQQQAIIAELAKYSLGNYELPEMLIASTAILVHYFDTKTSLFIDTPEAFTRVKEKFNGFQIIVGGLTPSGLEIRYNAACGLRNVGTAAQLKLIT